MQQRLRNQPVTVKPRVTVNGGAFKVDYFGPHVKEHCGTGHPTFQAAIEAANRVARRYPMRIEVINAERAKQREARLKLKNMREQYGVDPLDVAA